MKSLRIDMESCKVFYEGGYDRVESTVTTSINPNKVKLGCC